MCDINDFVIVGGTLKSYLGHGGDVIIPNDVVNISHFAFNRNESIENVIIPDSVLHIDDFAFENCKKLKKITIGKGISHIGIMAFNGCPISQANISTTAIEHIPKNHLKEVKTLSGDSIDCQAFKNCHLLKEVIISESVKSINFEAFKNCKSLKSVEIGINVDFIDSSAFDDCRAITKINYKGTVDTWAEKGFGVAFFYSVYDLYINNCIAREIKITHAQNIERYAFVSCKSIKSVLIGDSVKSIKDLAFSDCFYLREIIMECKLLYVGKGIFANCIPNRIKIPTSFIPMINKNKLEEIEIYDGEEIEKNSFWGCDNLKKVFLGDTITKIEESAFRFCCALKTVSFGQKIKIIERYAFEGCDLLTTVYYTGDKQQWDAVLKEIWNFELLNAKYNYNSCCKLYLK